MCAGNSGNGWPFDLSRAKQQHLTISVGIWNREVSRSPTSVRTAASFAASRTAASRRRLREPARGPASRQPAPAERPCCGPAPPACSRRASPLSLGSMAAVPLAGTAEIQGNRLAKSGQRREHFPDVGGTSRWKSPAIRDIIDGWRVGCGESRYDETQLTILSGERPLRAAQKRTAGRAYRISSTVNTVRPAQFRQSGLPVAGRRFSSSALATSASSSRRCTGLDAATYRSRRSSIA